MPERRPYRRELIHVDGSDVELLQEIAGVCKVGDEVKDLLEKEQKEEALGKIVKASIALNSVPEKDFGPAYNLLIFLVLESEDPKKYLPTICQNLQKPITSSPVNGRDLAIGELTNVFNLLAKNDPLRYNVFMQILRFVKMHSMFDLISGALKNIPGWLEEWDMDDEDKRTMYVEISNAAAEADAKEEAYRHLLLALRTFDPNDAEEFKSEEAQQLSLRALRMILLIDKPWAYDFQGLQVLAPVQALSESHPVYAQLLDIFTEQDLDDFNDFNEEHEGFLEKENLDYKTLQTKMRLLTFASVAASHERTREVPYDVIAKALQIPQEQVELWIIDVIRAQLVEGRMSQREKVFKVHRTTHRVFSEKQWRELQSRIDGWKTTLTSVEGVIRQAQTEAEQARERQAQEVERRLQQAGLGDGPQRGDRRGGGRGQQSQQRERTDNDD
ncbi:Eukaryotic translation initiation factor 3 subunit M [Pleurostoma richardsiae]|uniref:Eukaryotic translation initiation factor 3 subunit M n=1 Tax=Pleurostoma richardsiae TaxID=41990 RepID=A0AA38RJV7_9PEZI|nr:Eukaryotic translation initiation factor 3 subunit M [Pleurostoma richardsiae]